MKKPSGHDSSHRDGNATSLDAHWLDRREHRNWSHYGRTPSRRERERERLLRDWFGPERGSMEIMAHQSPSLSIGEAMTEVMSGLGLGRHLEFTGIEENWPDLVGPDIARQARPIALREKRLDVEVNNPSWMYVLQTVHGKQIEKRVRDFTEGRVTTVSFVPQGRHYNPTNRRRNT